ncbi:MAG: hypothetical protein GXP42_04690 [Chloroflexi bacterium]|nr:hypothetical protein [Chloroflexota bacterium]
MIIDWSFIITIAVILLASLLGAWLRARRRDDCLVSFEGFHVTLALVDGRRIWGVMDVLPTGLELHYRNAVQDDHHLESSYLLYSNEFEQIEAIFRYADDLLPEKQREREKAIQQAFHPNPTQKLKRKTRNFISAASASLNEIFGMTLSRARKPAGQLIDASGETHLKKLGQEVIGQAGLQTDPLLERLIGVKIVFETVEDGVIHEHVGILKEYTSNFYEILDVQFPQPETIPVIQQETQSLAGLEVSAKEHAISIKNGGHSPVLLQSLSSDKDEQYLDVLVDPGGELTIHVEFEFTEATLHARVIRALDMIVPRTRAVIRHRAEVREENAITEIVFDMGVRLVRSKHQQRQEKKLRKRLQENPNDALALANLGALLLQEQALDEAEEMLTRAYAMRFSLPDNGRSVEIHLRELRRRRQRQSPDLQAPPPTSPTEFTVHVEGADDSFH